MFSSDIAPEKGFLSVYSESAQIFLDFTQNNAFTCVWLKHVALSFIAQKKKCFGLVAVKLCVFQWYCTGKRFSFGLQRVRPNFPWFYSKQRFYLCLAKLRCCRILILRTTFSSFFVRRLHIWRSILPEKCFGLLATKLGCFEPYVTKNSVFSLLCLKYVAFSFIAGRTCFGLFAVTVGSSQRYCNGKRCSPSLQRVTLIFTWFYSTKRFRLFPARLRCFQHVFGNRLFLSFLPKLRFWPFILPKPSFGLVATKLEASSFMSQKAAI